MSEVTVSLSEGRWSLGMLHMKEKKDVTSWKSDELVDSSLSEIMVEIIEGLDQGAMAVEVKWSIPLIGAIPFA